MKKLTKILLAISILGFVIGFTTDWYYGLGRPIGAMFLGWFLVFKLLEKEMDLFDTEQQSNLAMADARNGKLSSAQKTGPARPANAPKLAHSAMSGRAS